MRYSPEALTAFVETVSCGSFSAAARRLRKSQSTISTAIAHLEADLGVQLFDRSSRQPVLTEEGKKVLGYVQAILSASDRLDEVALSLTGETEARLTFVLSDTLHPDVLEELMVQFDRQFPYTEFECQRPLSHRYRCDALADANVDGTLRCRVPSAGEREETAMGSTAYLA